MQSSSNISTFPDKQRQQQLKTWRRQLFKEYQLQPKCKSKCKPSHQPKVSIKYPWDIPLILDLKQPKLVLHRLRLPYNLQQELQRRRRRDQGTQTIDLYDQPRKEASTQTTAATTATTTTSTDDLYPLDSSFSEDELEEIARSIAKAEPATRGHTPTPEPEPESPPPEAERSPYQVLTELLDKIDQHLDNIEKLNSLHPDPVLLSPPRHVSPP